MNKRVFHTIIVILAGYSVAFAQPDSLTVLKNITIAESRYQALPQTQYQYKPDTLAKLWLIAPSMAEFLIPETTVHVRQYAPGSVATYSARGATSAQSVVLWDGFSVSAAGTGLTDLSLVPQSFFDASMTRGGSTALFGSGAIGSAINLGNITARKGLHLKVYQRVGSFSTMNTAATISYAAHRFWSVSQLDLGSSANNFGYADPLNVNGKTKYRQNAAYKQQNFAQQFGVTLGKKMAVKGAIWYTEAQRQSPRNILSNIPGKAELNDNSLKTNASWQYFNNKSTTEIGYAFLSEWQNYIDPLLPTFDGGNTNDTNITKSHILRADHFVKRSQNWKWQHGFQIRFDRVAGSNRIGTQATASLQSGFNYDKKKWTVNAALRLEMRDNKLFWPAPFVGVKYALKPNLFLQSTLGYNYRLPTLNDKYWKPGGNLYLKPEQGTSADIALNQILKHNTAVFTWRISAFASIINNYIQWIPKSGAIWQPENLKKVALSGVDLNGSWSKTMNKLVFILDAAASFNSSKAVESYLPNDQSVNKQLVYQPIIKTNTRFSVAYSGFTLGLNFTTVGKTTATYDGSASQIGSYQLIGTGISKNINIKKAIVALSFNLENLGNTNYQTILYYPMPGRMYYVTIKFNI